MRFILLITFLLFTASGHAQESLLQPDNPNKSSTPVPKELTLRDAIMLALRYHPNVRNAEIDRITQKYALVVADYQFQPQYSLAGASNYMPGQGNGTVTSITPTVTLQNAIGTQFTVTGSAQKSTASGTQRGANFSVTQPLVKGFGRDVVQAGLMNTYDAERINKLVFKQQVMNIVTGVIQAYINLVTAQNSLKTQELSLKSSLGKLEQERLKVKAGRMAPADLIQVEANFAQQQVAIIATKTTLEQTRLALLTAIGLDPNTKISISKEVHLPEEIIPRLKKATELILKNDTDYQSQLITRTINERLLLLAKDALRPTLNVNAAEGTGDGPGEGSRTVGLQFSVPIDNKPLKSALLQAQVTLKKTAINLQYKKWALESAVLNQLRTLDNQKQQVDMTILSRKLAKRSLGISEKKLEFGRSSTFEMTTLRTELINAELAAINAKNVYISSIANLQLALGTTLDVWKIEVRY